MIHICVGNDITKDQFLSRYSFKAWLKIIEHQMYKIITARNFLKTNLKIDYTSCLDLKL
jgi:hypothetical protein